MSDVYGQHEDGQGRREDAGSGRHPLHTGYLVAGLVFLGIAVSWALRAAEVVDDEATRWILPLVLVVAGLVGLASTVTRSAARSRRAGAGGLAEDHEEWQQP